ncbi:MAG TPA: 3-hydroxyacyl-ACP dehydratase FabZ [Gammaproteobacteria bacterium]
MMDSFLLGVEEIKQRLPHRDPFLMLDGVLSCDPGVSIVAVKDIRPEEPQFAGHFPGHPIMPGVLILEAMAQAGGVLIWESIEPSERNFILYLVGVEKARFKKPALPGDRIVLSVDIVASRRNLWRFDAKAEIDGAVVATAEILQAPGKSL